MKIAIYPGSFDPITNGHLDIIERSAMIFDKLIVSISKDNKKTATFRVEEKIEMIEQIKNDILSAELRISASGNSMAKRGIITISVCTREVVSGSGWSAQK